MTKTDLLIAYKNVSTERTGEYLPTKTRKLSIGEYDFSKGKVIVDNDEIGTKPASKKHLNLIRRVEMFFSYPR